MERAHTWVMLKAFKAIGAVCLFAVVGCGSQLAQGWAPNPKAWAQGERKSPAKVAVPPEPIVTCTTVRTTERVVEVRCQSTPDAPAGDVIAQGYLGAIREANGIGATWIQHMGMEGHVNRDEPVCQTTQTRRSRMAQALTTIGNSYSRPTATATCRNTFGRTVTCDIQGQPSYQTPLPEAEYESHCEPGKITDQVTVMRYELLTEEEAQRRGGMGEKPYRDTVDGYRELVKLTWAKRAQAGR